MWYTNKLRDTRRMNDIEQGIKRCMMIKMIALDMDGTLLNEQREISEENCAAIREAEAAGIEIVIATGRGYSSAVGILENYDFKRRYIVASGGEMRDEQGRVEKRVQMEYKTLKRIYEYCLGYPVTVHFCGDEHDYAVGTKEEIRQAIYRELGSFTGLTPMELEKSSVCQASMRRMVQIPAIEEIEKYRVYKAFIFSEDVEMLDELNQILIQIPGIVSASSFRTNLEITDIHAQKGLALEELAGRLGYTLGQVMAMGDSLNDESMLALPLGASVAMGNAHDRLKEICPYITADSWDDGVARAIRAALSGDLQSLKNPTYGKTHTLAGHPEGYT